MTRALDRLTWRHHSPPSYRNALAVMVDLQPATIPQAASADFIEEGHFTRHLRRMRNLYASRQSLLPETARAELSELLKIHESLEVLKRLAVKNGFELAVCSSKIITNYQLYFEEPSFGVATP